MIGNIGRRARDLLWFAAASLVLATVAACDRQAKEQNMTSPSKVSKMRTHCVGRFLIDLPETMRFNKAASYVQLYYGLDKNFHRPEVMVADQSGAADAFKSVVAKRVAELVGAEHLESSSKNMLASRKTIDGATELVRGYRSVDLVDAFNAEAYVDRGAAVGFVKEKIYSVDQITSVETRVLNISRRIQSLAPNFGPAQRGACLGPLVIDAGHDGEDFTVSFESGDVADLQISLSMNSILESSDGGLLARVQSRSSMTEALGFRPNVLRKGALTIGGRPAEELLETAKEKGKRRILFNAETLVKAPSTFAAPKIGIDMTMGGQVRGLPVGEDYVDASLSDQEALALWDAVVKSIRPRPGAI